MTIRSKRDLEIVLSKLHSYEQPSFKLEQYPTPSSIAADWIWTMAMRGEVAGKVILDAACGPGILGIGLLLLGAKHVFFVDKDEKIMTICQRNYEKIKDEYDLGEASFIVHDISLFAEDVDIAVQNPPFGTKEAHADKKFLEKAFSLAPVVYSMHKYATKKFVEAISKDHSFRITDVWRYEFPIKAAFAFHEKPVKKIDVGLWRMERESR
ncbi:methyltransferase [Candidatus Woesearchaeota archaeon]|nr:methyltransferase [Candidatus Woesearchaeota archaeon]